MRIFREWIRRLHGTLLPGRRDADLEHELRSHMENAFASAGASLRPGSATRWLRCLWSHLCV